MMVLKKNFVRYLIFICFIFLNSCDEKLKQEDINKYKEIMDVRLGHLGNALIMQGRLLEAHSMSSARADEDHFKEAEEIIKNHLVKLGRPDELRKLNLPNSREIRDMHNSIVEASEIMISAINMLEDQAWLGGSVGYAESVLERARFNFQNVVKTIYKPEGQVKPEFKPKEYEVGEKPELIEFDKK